MGEKLQHLNLFNMFMSIGWCRYNGLKSTGMLYNFVLKLFPRITELISPMKPNPSNAIVRPYNTPPPPLPRVPFALELASRDVFRDVFNMYPRYNGSRFKHSILHTQAHSTTSNTYMHAYARYTRPCNMWRRAHVQMHMCRTVFATLQRAHAVSIHIN